MNREPETEAGRRLAEEIYTVPRQDGAYTADILAIEAELRASLAEKVRGLPMLMVSGEAMSETLSGTEGVIGAEQFFVDWDEQEWFVTQEDVLRLIEGSDPASPEANQEVGRTVDNRTERRHGGTSSPSGLPLDSAEAHENLTCDCRTLEEHRARWLAAPYPATPVAGSTIPHRPLDVLTRIAHDAYEAAGDAVTASSPPFWALVAREWALVARELDIRLRLAEAPVTGEDRG